MDGVDLIICLAIWTLYKRRPPLTSDDFRAISIASRNKLRLTSLFGEISMDFGKVLEPKIEAKIDFWEVFLRSFFERVSASIFGRFFEAPDLKNSNFVPTGARFLQMRRFQKTSETSLILATFSKTSI